jgi:hypothetical protein
MGARGKVGWRGPKEGRRALDARTLVVCEAPPRVYGATAVRQPRSTQLHPPPSNPAPAHPHYRPRTPALPPGPRPRQRLPCRPDEGVNVQRRGVGGDGGGVGAEGLERRAGLRGGDGVVVRRVKQGVDAAEVVVGEERRRRRAGGGGVLPRSHRRGEERRGRGRLGDERRGEELLQERGRAGGLQVRRSTGLRVDALPRLRPGRGNRGRAGWWAGAERRGAGEPKPECWGGEVAIPPGSLGAALAAAAPSVRRTGTPRQHPLSPHVIVPLCPPSSPSPILPLLLLTAGMAASPPAAAMASRVSRRKGSSAGGLADRTRTVRTSNSVARSCVLAYACWPAMTPPAAASAAIRFGRRPGGGSGATQGAASFAILVARRAREMPAWPHTPIGTDDDRGQPRV